MLARARVRLHLAMTSNFSDILYSWLCAVVRCVVFRRGNKTKNWKSLIFIRAEHEMPKSLMYVTQTGIYYSNWWYT
jgi:hypothetical protein